MTKKATTQSLQDLSKYMQVVNHVNGICRSEIRFYLRRLLNVEVVSDEVVERIKSQSACIYWEGIDLLGEFYDACRDCAPYGWREPGFGWGVEAIDIWCLLNWDRFLIWYANRKEAA